MLSELLISCTSTRQAAVLLHLTKSDTREGRRCTAGGGGMGLGGGQQTRRCQTGNSEKYLQCTKSRRVIMQESRYFPLAASGPPQALHLPSVYQEEQPPGFAPRSLHFGSAVLFSLSRFRLYVIIFFFLPSPLAVLTVLWICAVGRHVARRVRARLCVWACTLCKCRSFQSPIGVQSPNQLTAQVLILSAHKLLFLFLISNEHICTDICFSVVFPPPSSLSCPREKM